jgi:hypothetical protein
MKRLFITVSLVFMLVVPTVSYAKDFGNYEPPVLEEKIIDVEGIELGESVQFQAEVAPIDEEVSPMAVEWMIKTLSGPTKVKKHVRYLTGSWAKASSYTWSKAQSTSATISTDLGLSAEGISSKLGVSKTTTTTFTIAIVIPADSSKFSKLAFYSDFDQRYVQVQGFNKDMILTSDKKGYHYAPRKDTYLQVVYQ